MAQKLIVVVVGWLDLFADFYGAILDEMAS